MSLVSVVFCEVELSAITRPEESTDCGASLSVNLETSKMRRLWPNEGCCGRHKTIATRSSKFTESRKNCWSDKATVSPLLLNIQLRLLKELW